MVTVFIQNLKQMLQNIKPDQLRNYVIPLFGTKVLPNFPLRKGTKGDDPVNGNYRFNSSYSFTDIIKIIAIILITIGGLSACSSNDTAEETTATARAPVSVTHVKQGSIGDSVALSATTFYLSNSEIAAPVSGYITEGGLQPGDQVKQGQTLFEIKTREANALQSGSDPDTLAGVSNLGNVQIKAPSDGFLSSVAHVKGDYVQEGGSLARLVRADNLYFKLFVPYEYRSVIQKKDQLTADLPSGNQLSTTVTGTLNQTDPASQSVVWLLKPDHPQMLPEGLNLSIQVPARHHPNAQLLPKEAVLADETLQSFWVMKVVNDTLAVKVPVTKGIETGQQVEIVSPQFSPSDKIINSGQYGLEDSSSVNIVNPG